MCKLRCETAGAQGVLQPHKSWIPVLDLIWMYEILSKLITFEAKAAGYNVLVLEDYSCQGYKEQYETSISCSIHIYLFHLRRQAKQIVNMT